MRFPALSLSLALAAVAALHGAAADGDWKDGRATFYGLDGWSIHRGSCGFGYQWPDLYPGFDVAALSDASAEYSGSCGRCYEVKCRPADLTDGYGAAIPRGSACKDAPASVVVRTVDTCPCVYPANAYSNKRWCCGDAGAGAAHMDLSVWAFEKLADTKVGAVGIAFREVPCSHAPDRPAPALGSPSPAEAPPAGAKRPDQQIYVQRFDAEGAAQGAVTTVEDASAAGDRPVVPLDQIYRDGTFDPDSEQYSGGGGGAGGGPAPEGAAAGNGCTDAAPGDGHTCEEQKGWGKCGENWLIAGNYCRATCGRCTLG